LFSTFGGSIGEIALTPTTGGIFTVHIEYKASATDTVEKLLVWDRKVRLYHFMAMYIAVNR